jgi:hypothetical protein
MKLPECFGQEAYFCLDDCVVSCPYWEECLMAGEEEDDDEEEGEWQ